MKCCRGQPAPVETIPCSNEVSRTFGKAYKRKTGTHVVLNAGPALQIEIGSFLKIENKRIVVYKKKCHPERSRRTIFFNYLQPEINLNGFTQLYQAATRFTQRTG